MLIRNLSNADYHNHPAANSSILKRFGTETPATVKHSLDNKEDSESDSMLLGSVTHCLILEPHVVDKAFVIEKEPLPDKTKAVRNGGSKEIWEAMKKDSEASGIPLVKHELWKAACAISAKVRQHPFYPVIEGGQNEISIFNYFNDVWQKARLDCWSESTGTIIDIKTSRHTLTDRAIQKEILDRGYHVSAAMYLEVARSEGLDPKRFVWLFIENFPPYNCRFVEASEIMLMVGKEEYLRYLEIYKHCLVNNDWYDYGTDVDLIEIPDWYLKRDRELLGKRKATNQ